MEVIGVLLLIFVVNALVGSFKNAGKRARTQQTRRVPAHSPRRGLEDIVNQMMGQVWLEDPAEGPPIEAEFAGGAYMRELTPSFVPLSGFAEGDSRQDGPGCVGGSMAHDLHEGEEFPGHVHANAAPLAVSAPSAVSEPLAARAAEPAGIRARLAGGQARYAMVAAEVLGRPVSMRKGGYRF